MSKKEDNSALIRQGWVLRALILRDIRTRFFGNGLGYILAILWPFSHIVILLIIYNFSGRIPPIGSSTPLFIAAAVVPAICFSYSSRFIMLSVITNKPLMSFPAVKFTDLVISRCILESATCVCVAVLVSSLFSLMNLPVSPDNPFEAASAFLASLLLGTGIGSVNSVIVLKLPGWMLIYILINIVLYISSGTIFFVNGLPEEMQYIISWNPLAHAVEWMREGYFAEYASPILSKTYLLGCGAISLLAALVAERVFRRFLFS